MKKRGLFIIILVIFVSIPALSFFLNWSFCSRIHRSQPVPGAFRFEDGQSPFFLDEYLACEWEYYPGQLIYSENTDGAVSGELTDSDPAALADAIRNNELPAYTPAEYSTRLNPDAEHILLPAGLSPAESLFSENPRSASYRLVLMNCPEIPDPDIVISFQGLINGNYAYYVNGQKCPSLIAPFGYPATFIHLDKEMELVVEVSNADTRLNIIPRIAHKGTAMTAMDSNKYLLAAIAAVLIIASVILMILVFAVEPSKYRWHFIISLIFSLCYVAMVLWVSGFLVSISKAIPTYMLSRLPRILLFIGMTTAFYTMRRFYASAYREKLTFSAIVLSLAALVLEILTAAVPGISFSLVLNDLIQVLEFTAIILWLIRTFQTFSLTNPLDLFFFQTGFLALICGYRCAQIYNLFGVQSLTLYIFPICLMIYLILIFISSKNEQKQLVKNTLKLLDLEKENTQFQAALLSSKLRPHFLYNTLASIQEMCYTDPEMASEMIVHLSQYLRKNIDFMDYSDVIPFSQELSHIDDYLYIQKARYGSSLNYEQFIGFRDFLIPPFTVQPLIENAINYGVRKSSGGGTVRLETYEENNIVHIRVSNSGPGFDTSSVKPNHSIRNIENRIRTLASGSLKIISNPEGIGTRVEIEFPLKNTQELKES